MTETTETTERLTVEVLNICPEFVSPVRIEMSDGTVIDVEDDNESIIDAIFRYNIEENNIKRITLNDNGEIIHFVK